MILKFINNWLPNGGGIRIGTKWKAKIGGEKLTCFTLDIICPIQHIMLINVDSN